MLDLNKSGVKVMPTARQMAQARMIAKKVGLSPVFADVLADAGLPVMKMEVAAETLKQISEMTNTLVTDATAIKDILEKVVADIGANPDDPAAPVAVLDEARHSIMAYLANQGDNNSHGRSVRSDAGHSWDMGDGLRARMVDGLLARVNPGHKPTMGADFAQVPLVDIAKACLQANGQRFTQGSPGKIVMDAQHSTSDFAKVLGEFANKRLVDFYAAAASGLKLVSTEMKANDFRALHAIRLGGSIDLNKVLESGEFTEGTLSEADETYKVETYGRILSVSRQLIINDDLNAFDNVSRIMGQGAAMTENKLFVALLNANSGLGPTMSDGLALFQVTHANLAAVGAALSITSLGAARLALRRQKGLGGESINVLPAFLVVPPELETLAEQLLATIDAKSFVDANPFSGKLTLIVDANLTSATRWYLVAAQGTPEGLQHAYLDGAIGPQFFTKEGFEVDGMQFKCRLDFGAGFVDHRAWYMNPGV